MPKKFKKKYLWLAISRLRWFQHCTNPNTEIISRIVIEKVSTWFTFVPEPWFYSEKFIWTKLYIISWELRFSFFCFFFLSLSLAIKWFSESVKFARTSAARKLVSFEIRRRDKTCNYINTILFAGPEICWQIMFR